MTFREIEQRDIPTLFHIRTSIDENTLSLRQLAEMGITQESVHSRIVASCKGWLCETDDRAVGFAIGDKKTGEMWVIAVLPEYINRGIGSKLIVLVEEWLFSNGWPAIWLTTDIDDSLRAYTFYRKHGWKDKEIRNGTRYMIKKHVPNAPADKKE